MTINPSIEGLSWLRQPNPGEYLLQSQNSAVEVARNFMSAYENAQRQAREDAFMPLRKQMFENQIKNTALDIEERMNAQADYLKNKEAFNEIGRLAKEISERGEWASPKSEAAIWDVASRYPSVVATPQFKQVIQQFDVAGAAALKAKDAETRALKAQSDADYKTQALGLREEQMKLKDLQHANELSSREKIASEANASRERAAAERNKAMVEAAKLKVDRDHKDRLDDMEYRAFLETADKIAADSSLTPAAVERQINEALQRAMDRSKARKGATNAPATAPAATRRRFNPVTGKIE